MACNLEISMSCVTEAKEEGRSSNSSSLEMLRYRESGACMFDQVKGDIFFLFFLFFFFFFYFTTLQWFWVLYFKNHTLDLGSQDSIQ